MNQLTRALIAALLLAWSVITIADAVAPVLAAEDARFAAMIGAKEAELGQWLSDDLLYVHSTGQIANREQFIASIVSGEFRYYEITPIERQVIMLGTRSALVRGRGRIQAETGGNRLDLQIRYLCVYSKSGGRWRLRSWQSLRLPPGSG
ncbi:MAG: nuclear transport factor 2 family protein [Steroidobacteraceae bacterium]